MDRNRMPRGRSEVPVENGKYTLIIDHRPGMEGLAALRYNEPWISSIDDGANMFISMALELERCRDLLHAIRHDYLHGDKGDNFVKDIDEALPKNYQPATYR